MEEFARKNLEMLLEEVVSAVLGEPLATSGFGPLVALIGRPEVEQLVSEAKQALTLTDGYKDGATVRLLMERVLRDPDRARRLAKAYGTLVHELEHEAVRREEEDPYASEDQGE